jgi:hypothetical protein
MTSFVETIQMDLNHIVEVANSMNFFYRHLWREIYNLIQQVLLWMRVIKYPMYISFLKPILMNTVANRWNPRKRIFLSRWYQAWIAIDFWFKFNLVIERTSFTWLFVCLVMKIRFNKTSKTTRNQSYVRGRGENGRTPSTAQFVHVQSTEQRSAVQLCGTHWSSLFDRTFCFSFFIVFTFLWHCIVPDTIESAKLYH